MRAQSDPAVKVMLKSPLFWEHICVSISQRAWETTKVQLQSEFQIVKDITAELACFNVSCRACCFSCLLSAYMY